MLNVACSPLIMKENCLTIAKKRIMSVNIRVYLEKCKRLDSVSAVKAKIC
jgi:hypothetical protein